uniref:Transmembrane protein 61 n=1 Tax=Chrysemys picta bellii TaxID=8478 RepID=A0A8C3H6R3_CHRPI
MAASFRYGVTITGAILLVTGTLCFAWWSDGEVGPTSNNDAMAVPHGEAKVVPNSSSSNALLRSVSFFCCGIGGILLLFGLLWSVKANARGMSRHYQYHFSRDLHYFTVEPLDKRTCRTIRDFKSAIRIHNTGVGPALCAKNCAAGKVFLPPEFWLVPRPIKTDVPIPSPGEQGDDGHWQLSAGRTPARRHRGQGMKNQRKKNTIPHCVGVIDISL